MKIIKIVIQVAFLTLIYLAGSMISNYLDIPIPGGIVGLVILFLLLQLKIIKVEWIEKGADWLLAELMLFFIPAAVGIVNYQKAIGSKWVSLLIVIVLSSLTVMAVTGLTAQYISKRGRGAVNGSSDKNR
ncbi:CidA/LrgA family protein [Peribacillus kribbensis]|uniref:CidA/LrgA family protein n=1 Tax=Peribacillus kribbensis TaxID=356658 RepID=UPI00041FFA80|nr:CidA/LrgA family holin-like protein [Peribacillus kribbensis]